MRRIMLSILLMILASQACGDRYTATSLVELIGDPEYYSGHNVMVFGWLHRAGNLRLYLTRDHAVAMDFPSSAAVMVEETRDLESVVACADAYVFVHGRVVMEPQLGVALEQIERIEFPGWESCYEYGSNQ